MSPPLKIMLTFLLVLLLASLALNYLLFARGRQYYLALNALRLDPADLSHYAAESKQQAEGRSNQATIVFFGDSRAANWPAPAGLDEFIFINRGIGGQTSTQVAQRVERHLTPLQPQIVILQTGINDLKTIPLFPAQKETIIANCKANIRQTTAQLQQMGATVIVTTIFPVGKVPLERRLFWSDDVAAAVNDVNGFIRTLTGDRVIIFDAYLILADDKGMMRSEYSEDELQHQPEWL